VSEEHYGVSFTEIRRRAVAEVNSPAGGRDVCQRVSP
jgi:hypothetical protein